MSFADIEKNIGELGQKARDGKITIEDLQGGTFTITNGGIYGSMLSTPILNPPQSAVLGMHNIVERPVVINGISPAVSRPDLLDRSLVLEIRILKDRKNIMEGEIDHIVQTAIRRERKVWVLTLVLMMIGMQFIHLQMTVQPSFPESEVAKYTKTSKEMSSLRRRRLMEAGSPTGESMMSSAQ